MQLKRLLNEDDAVSPVIGVILMVAITVILAAVIATFVLGLGEQVSDNAPQASFTFDYDEDYEDSDTDSWGDGPSAVNGSSDPAALLTITHSGGPTVDKSNLGATGSNVDGISDYSDWGTAPAKSGSAPGVATEVSAGDRVDIWMNSDDQIQITWTNDEDTNSATLQRFSGPDR